MDDVFGLKAVTLGEARLACGATTQGQALLEQPGAGSQMNCPIHTIATIEAFIRRIDNCVNLKSGDVALKNLNTVHVKLNRRRDNSRRRRENIIA